LGIIALSRFLCGRGWRDAPGEGAHAITLPNSGERVLRSNTASHPGSSPGRTPPSAFARAAADERENVSFTVIWTVEKIHLSFLMGVTWMTTMTLKMRVSFTPKNYREFDIGGNSSLYELAKVINQLYGFLFDHAFGFYDNLDDLYKSKTVYELFADMGDPVVDGAKSVKKTKIVEAFARDDDAMLFLFDYGDEWMFKIERCGLSDVDLPKDVWRMTKSVGKSPKQY
jgi:Plasmid pRiA4b ORF-3-like protein